MQIINDKKKGVKMMQIKESGEDYLESILILSKKQGNVRATDICSYFGYSRASVSVVLKHFREDGYVKVDENNYITLTEKGLAIANNMYERHQVIAAIFKQLGVPEDIAVKDACRVEHYISDETFEAMKEHFNMHRTDNHSKN